MPCYTIITVKLDDTAINRRARKKLGLSEEGNLSSSDARRVRQEAAVLKAQDSVRKLDPRAIVRRKGNKLVVTVQR